jgi:hypothetical protein
MNAISPAPAAYATAATSKGTLDGSASYQWATRPDEQRFLDLDALHAQVSAWAEESHEILSPANAIRALPSPEVGIAFEVGGEVLTPTNWSFGQTCAALGAPAAYLAKQHPKLAAVCLQADLMRRGGDGLKAYARENGDLRAMTGPEYGRILDRDVVGWVRKVAGPGSGWKVPGMIDWSSAAGGMVKHNPHVDVTKENTTLYASDRDLWCFLCQDEYPIQIGKLDNGQPDLVFRGFIVSNSEVGSRTLKLRTFLLRGVCCNRNLWGVQDVSEIKIRHTKIAPEKWQDAMDEIAPALAEWAKGSTWDVVAKVKAAKAIEIAKADEPADAIEWMVERGLSKRMAERAMVRVMEEEGHPLQTLWDACNGITALARSIQHQDDRVELETLAGRWMDKVKA